MTVSNPKPSELWSQAMEAGHRRLNKYGAKATTVDGIRFHSKAEATYYANLRLREKAGEVTDVKLQEPFVVIGPKGLVVCTAVIDFVFWDNVEKRRRIVDVKGKQTSESKLKYRVVEAFLGITIELTD